MIKNKAILILIVIQLYLLILTGCSTKDKGNNSIFQLDQDGYPIPTIIYINDLAFEIKDGYEWNKKDSFELEYNLKEDNEVRIVLPKVDSVCSWSINDTTNGFKLKEHESMKPDLNYSYDKEGQTEELQKFVLQITDKAKVNEIEFKWANIDNLKENFDEIDEYYLLKIVFK